MGRVLAQGDSRPMANRENAMDELRSILAAREPLYAQADGVIDTSAADEEAVFAELLRTTRDLGWAES
jgi:XRE family aerobic/anaerobic benzoate catabolism transcriptional regulator